MKESELVAQVLEYLPYRGAIGIRVNSGMQVITEESGRQHVFKGARPGTSDIICCFRGLFLAIECKVGKNKPTALQQAFIDEVNAAGGEGFVIWSLDDLIKRLNLIERIKGTS